MSKILILILITCFSILNLNSAVVDIGKQGQFPLDVWYNIVDGTQNSRSATEWDLAFEMQKMSGGIFINDFRGDVLYYVGTDWAAKIDTADISKWTRYYNSDSSWHIGALNRNLDGYNQTYDFGWGAYDMNTHSVGNAGVYKNGSPVFVLKYASGKWAKITIVSKDQTFKYQFKISTLDGSSEGMYDLPLTDNKNFTYFIDDVTKQDNITLREPDVSKWDLQFGRYLTKIPAGPGTFMDYTVVGVRQNPNIRSMMLDNVDTGKVVPIDFTLLSHKIGTIGWDWKSFDQANNVYKMVAKRVYLVQRIDPSTQKAIGDMYKLIFDSYDINSAEITFNTSILKGTSVESTPDNKTSLYVINSLTDRNSDLDLAISSEFEQSGTITIFDIIGNKVSSQNTNISTGLNNLKIANIGLNSGMYYIRLDLNHGFTLNDKFIVK